MAPLDSQNLLDDFVRCQIAFPAVEAAGAEFTAIGATYLGGNAQRMPVTGVTVERRIGWNENTFDQRMIAQTPEEFPRGIVGALLTDEFQHLDRKGRSQFIAQTLGQIGHIIPLVTRRE